MTRQFRGSSLGKLGLQRWLAPFLTSDYNLISWHQICVQSAPELVSFSPEFVSFSPGYFLFFIKNITEVVSYQPLEFGWPKSCFFFRKRRHCTFLQGNCVLLLEERVDLVFAILYNRFEIIAQILQADIAKTWATHCAQCLW